MRRPDAGSFQIRAAAIRGAMTKAIQCAQPSIRSIGWEIVGDAMGDELLVSQIDPAEGDETAIYFDPFHEMSDQEICETIERGMIPWGVQMSQLDGDCPPDLAWVIPVAWSWDAPAMGAAIASMLGSIMIVGSHVRQALRVINND